MTPGSYQLSPDALAADLAGLLASGATLLLVVALVEMPDGETRELTAVNREAMDRRAMLAAVPATGGVQ